jgi:signal transduction histidine kinase
MGPPWSTNSSTLTVMFLVVLVPPALILVWLGIRLLQQEQKNGLDRELERRHAASEGIIRSLQQSLNDAESRVADGQAVGIVSFTMSASGVAATPAGRVAWLPIVPRLAEAARSPFIEAESIELRGQGDAVLGRYEALTRSADLGVRAGALLRVARVHRRNGRIDRALRAYRQLAGMTRIAIEGAPADFVARRAVCDLLRQTRQTAALDREAASLRADLLANRWQLDRDMWDLAAVEIAEWTSVPLATVPEQRALSSAGQWLWDAWRPSDGTRLPPSGHHVLVDEDMAVTVTWKTIDSRLHAIAISSPDLETWLQQAVGRNPGATARVSVLAPSGALLVGEAPDRKGAVRRTAADTGLPWTLVLSATTQSHEAAQRAGSRGLLAAGLAAIVLFLAGGSYLLWRVVSREIAVARLQTDFVAAVSHEFRTPITSLRHVTELLDDDDRLPEARRKAFYSALRRNTDRLHRLVESLLDFAGMEHHSKAWDMRAVDAGELVRTVVADFVSQGSRRVTLNLDSTGESRLWVHADAEALTQALWNLLDNAMKYSPGQQAIHVSIHPHGRGIAISVRDEGLGIPERERQEIFRKFVRGTKARELGIKGTGLGLAMVSSIAEAHGGVVEVETEEGRGSTFRLVLPVRI